MVSIFSFICTYGIDFKERPVCGQQGARPWSLWYTRVVHTGGWEIAGLKEPSHLCVLFSGVRVVVQAYFKCPKYLASGGAALGSSVYVGSGAVPQIPPQGHLLFTRLPRKRSSSLLSPAQSLMKAAWYWLLLMPVDCSDRRQGQPQLGPGVPLILQLPLWISTPTLPRIPVINGRAISAGSQGAGGSRQEIPSSNLIDAWFRKLEPGFA